jgi:uncharacterized protein
VLMKKPNVMVIHGAYGYPEENWFDWLRKELHGVNIECHVPQLPTPENQHLSHWTDVFNDSCQHLIHSNTIMIGHSLGAAFVLRWLEQQDCQLKTVVLVGAFLGEVGIEKFDSINQSFFETEFDWRRIQKNSRQFICYYGDNDPYVKRDHFNFIADHLSAVKIIVSKAGHFNAASGYIQFPQLLIQLKKIMETNNND